MATDREHFTWHLEEALSHVDRALILSGKLLMEEDEVRILREVKGGLELFVDDAQS
jgi:hypothetical protein